jgi:tRNA threonylcarbamoyladenosine biosynthesis protein TsaB
MIILALETSTRILSLAVAKDEKILRARNIKPKQVLSSAIILEIKKILKAAKLTLKDVDGLAIGLGPGSFTGLRVGLATIKGLAFAAQKEVVGLCSLDTMVMNVLPDIPPDISAVCCVVDARRNLLYTANYEVKGKSWQRISAPQLISVEELLANIQQKTLFVGDGLKIYQDVIRSKVPSVFASQENWRPQARHLARLARERFRQGQTDTIMKLKPLYLYPADCQVRQEINH